MTDRQIVPLAGLLVILWASNWPASQLALETMPPITFRLTTLLGGAVALLLICARSRQLFAIHWKEWPKLVMLSLLNVGIFNVLSAYSISALEGGRAVIIAFTMPIWVTIIEVILGCVMTYTRIIALVAGILGLTVVVYSVAIDPSYEPLSAFLMFVAALSWAVGSVWMARAPFGLGAKPVAMWMMVLSSLFVALLIPLQEEPLSSFPTTRTGWMGLLFATVIGMGMCQVLWFSILAKAGPFRSAYILLAIPPLATWLSWYFIKASVTAIDAVGLSLLLLAAITSALSKSPSSPRTELVGSS